MLANPEWDKKNLLDNWIGWLETKDPNEAYEWRFPAGCALGQWHGNAGWIGLPGFSALNTIARGSSSFSDQSDWTFGRCLERARKYSEWQHLGYLTNAG